MPVLHKGAALEYSTCHNDTRGVDVMYLVRGWIHTFREVVQEGDIGWSGLGGVHRHLGAFPVEMNFISPWHQVFPVTELPGARDQIGHGTTLGRAFEAFRVPTKILYGTGCHFWQEFHFLIAF